jgi:prevent-host-death family protein
MPDTAVVSATEFKATCLDLLDKLASHQITRLTVTKRGKPVAVLIPPEPEAAPDLTPFDQLYGAGQGLITWPEGYDLTQSPFEGMLIHAEQGWLLSQDSDGRVDPA